LELARSVGNDDPEIVVFGIEPDRVGPSPDLSEALRARLGEYASAVAHEF
jgi:hypothetical protein